MKMELQVSNSIDCEAEFQPENVTSSDGGSGGSSSENLVVPEKPAKKQTRQWAAWTRQEEESFFTALRQVGKNFEKITCRVQSKNKDQVRHYYYRLVRRMNKLLGPSFCLDAKNSKDTNAAMLRWWSLLEKYSCKASKLHLKPRRFKIFIDALEDQLLKDQRKKKRRRPMPAESSSSPVAPSGSNQSRASGHEGRAVKIIVDGQNMKSRPRKGSSSRRYSNVGGNCGNSKGYSPTTKAAKQRRKPVGPVSSSAYKRWEKAVIAGVSLVAEAAEHLERTADGKDVGNDQCMLGEKDHGPDGQAVPTLPKLSQNFFTRSSMQSPVKLKLQLFPIDEGTRRALEMDKHNPHLELTLSMRKKISSVLEHLSCKWGNSSVASGELMLFPYNIQRENLKDFPRWTQESSVSAADVYTWIGSPPVFRLRYGWFSSMDLGSVTSQPSLASSFTLGDPNKMYPTLASITASAAPPDEHTQNIATSCVNQLTRVAEKDALLSSSSVQKDALSYDNTGPNNMFMDSSNPAESVSLQKKEIHHGKTPGQMDDVDDLRISNAPALSAREWADSLTNISVGDILSEVSHEMHTNSTDPLLPGSSLGHQQVPFCCDSFDAAIAAHLSRHQNKTALVPHSSSIWDAEETCDAFSFQAIHSGVPSGSRISSLEPCKQTGRTSPLASATEGLHEQSELRDDLAAEDPMKECHFDPQVDNAAKDLNGLTDIYWPESLGLLDLDIPSFRYHTEDMILSDSFSGLNRLIANSLDAFHNCSFFGLDKKDPGSVVESRENASRV